jgi:DNA-binding Lrp family transcriptional regulator
MRKELPQQLLKELLKNSKRSDRELAKVLGVSQPTITRARHKLEKRGTIQEYAIVPDFADLGFELLAVTFTKMRPEIRVEENLEKAKKYTYIFPNAIFVGMGEGMGMSGMIISFHTSFTDYHRKWNKMRRDWKDFLLDTKSFIVSLKSEQVKRFSLTYLADVLEGETPK